MRRFRRTLSATVLTAATVTTVAGAHATQRFYDDDPIWTEPNTQDASGVQPWEIDLAWDLVQNLFTKPGDRDVDTRAMNVNTVDEVPNGAWFTNRAGARPMTIEEVARGANNGSGPSAGRWRIVAAKSDGITPGFTVRDEHNDLWFIKFDPPGWRGMATGTEVAAAKLFWALGYHTPEYYVASLRLENLDIDDEAEITPPGSRARQMRTSDLDWLLESAERDADGSYRVIASKGLPGKPLGGFRFYGTRPDDPNDIYPHEHRRELRGYGVFAAWLNHVDAKSINSFDTLVADGGRSVVRHYLLDFGSTMGSAAVGPREHWEGHEHLFEGGTTARGIIGLGFAIRPWHSLTMYEAPAIGRIDRDDANWDPDKWRPRVRNPAFLRARADDRFWAARRVGAITDGMIRAAIASGQFGDTSAEEQLARYLIQRRNAITRRYLPAINPVVDPALDARGVLTFANAAVAAGVAREPTAYWVEWSSFDNTTGQARTIGESRGIGRIDPPAGVPTAPGTFLRLAIRAAITSNPEWEKPVHAYFRRAAEEWKLVGLERMVPGS